MPQLKVQNLYNTTITEDDGIPASGDCDFTVAVAPENTNGFIIISPENPILREIMYYHNVSGNRIYVRKENRFSPKAHSVTESVKMNDVAEIFNTFSDMISQAFYVEKTGGLTVRVWGGYVYYNGSPVSVPDTSLTMADNATNYIKYDYPSNTFSVDTVNSGNVKAQVITLGGVITSIGYRTAKESYIDFTVALTGALPDQTGNASKSLMTDGITPYWGTPNNLRAGLGASRQTLEVDATGNEVKKAITNGTQIQDTDTIRKRKGDGTYEEIPFLAVKNDLSSAGKYVQTVPLGEDIASGNPMAMTVISNGFTTESIPTLTSNTGNPSYIASGASNAWQVFDNQTPTAVGIGSWQYWEIMMDMLFPVFMNSYSVGAGSSNVLYITTSNASFGIQGSNDKALWETLGTFYNDGSGNTTPSSMSEQNTAYRYYKLYGTTGSWGATIYKWNFPFRYPNQNGAIPYTNTLGTNIAGNRIKSGIRFSVPYNTTLGTVKTSQVSTSTSARVQLFQDDGTTLVAEQTPSSSDSVIFPNTPLVANTIYRLVLNDNANFNNTSNELALASYQTGFRYAISGTLNGVNTVEPQNIKEVQLGTQKAMKAVANSTAEYAVFAGFVNGPKVKGDLVTLDANDGTFVSGFTGLASGTSYYVSNVAGVISTTPGTIKSPTGNAVTGSGILLGQAYTIPKIISFLASTSGGVIDYYSPVFIGFNELADFTSSGSSNITGFVIKLQSSSDGLIWSDIYTGGGNSPSFNETLKLYRRFYRFYVYTPGGTVNCTISITL